MINILIADDHEIVADGIKMLLQNEEAINILGSVSDGNAAVQFCKKNQVDICLMDINMPVMNGIQATKEICKLNSSKVIAITNHQELVYIYKMINAGASGYVLKISGKKVLLDAINEVSQGSNYFSEKVKKLIENLDTNYFEEIETPEVSLSRREKEILKLIVLGYTNLQISDKLFISKNTADKHRNNILKKLNANNTACLIRMAYETNVLYS